MAMAWRASSWTANGTVKALAPRVLGVELRRLADGKLVRVVGLHGMHGEEEKSVQQMLAAGAFVKKGRGGLVVGDMNRVACARWRVAKQGLSTADRVLRGWLGEKGCRCCQKGGGDAIEGEGEIPGEIVEREGDLQLTDGERFTRFRVDKGRCMEGTARLDQIWAFGDEVGAWKLGRAIIPRRGGGDRSRCLTDHSWVEASREVYACVRESRPSRRGMQGVAEEQAVVAQFLSTDGVEAAKELQRDGQQAESLEMLAATVVSALKGARVKSEERRVGSGVVRGLLGVRRPWQVGERYFVGR